MIALDTNILLRYLVQDDAEQAAAAGRLIETELSSEEPGFVSLPVLCELAWALGAAYRRSRDDIAAAIGSFLEVMQLEVQEATMVARVLEAGGADIADAIIHEVGRMHGCVRTLTFDRKFARMEGVELLTK